MVFRWYHCKSSNLKEVNMAKTLKDLMEFFNKQPRIGVLGTASKDGKPNIAHLGSPRMVDEKTVVAGLGQNRTLANLQENPYAVFTILEPGKSVPEWKGVRVYLKVVSIQSTGELLDSIRESFIKKGNEGAAKMMKFAVSFEITELRPLADRGQGWENMI